MVVRLNNTLARAGLFSLSATLPLAAQVIRDGIPASAIVIIQGQIKGSRAKWITYQNGAFSQDAYVNDFFRIPERKTLVIVEADLKCTGDSRKLINLDFVVNQGSFPLAHVSFRNEGGWSHFTATRSFALGLVVPPKIGSTQGMLNVQVYEPQPSAQYEVLLYGYFTD